MNASQKIMSLSILSWNVNGLRSVLRKGNLIAEIAGPCGIQPDIICLQETRCPCDLLVPGADAYVFKTILPSDKAGYAGVGIFSKVAPVAMVQAPADLGTGRCLCADFGEFYLINLYVPNSKNDLLALPTRTQVWEPGVRAFIKSLLKPVVVVADFNVAPDAKEDVYMYKPSHMPGASVEERAEYAKLLDECDLVDTFRELHPDAREWTWFSNFAGARANDHGWRIDMTLVSRSMLGQVVRSEILGHVFGSDHVPILLEFDYTALQVKDSS